LLGRAGRPAHVNKRLEAATVKNAHTPTACAHETLPLERRGRDGDSRPMRPKNTTRYHFVGDCNVIAVEARTRHERPLHIALLPDGLAFHAAVCITCVVRVGTDRSVVAFTYDAS